MATAYELTAKIVLDTEGFTSGMKDMEDQMQSFAGNLEGAGGVVDDFSSGLAAGFDKLTEYGTVAGVVAAGTKAVKALYDNAVRFSKQGDEIAKSAQKLSISAKAYQEFSNILEHNGANVSTLTTALRTMRNQVEAGNEAFVELGFNLRDIRDMNNEDLFRATIYSLQNVEDATRRAVLANSIYGKSYMELLPTLNQTNQQTDEIVENYHRLGGAIKDEYLQMAEANEDLNTDIRAAWDVTSAFWGVKMLPMIGTVKRFFLDQLAEYNRLNEMVHGTNEDFTETTESAGKAKAAVADAAITGATTAGAYAAQVKEATEKQTAEIAEAYVKAYEKALSAVDGFFGSFGKVNRQQSQSIQAMTKNLADQAKYYTDYAGNLQKIRQYGKDTETDMTGLASEIANAGEAGAAYASAIAEAIDSGKTDEVQNLVKAFEDMQTAQSNLAQGMTDATMWDALAESGTAALDKIAEHIGHIAGMSPVEIEFVDSLSGGVDGHHAGGLSYVPRNGYLAELHEGERVLTKAENREYTNGGGRSSGNISITQNIQAVPQTAAEFAATTAAYLEQARWLV